MIVCLGEVNAAVRVVGTEDIRGPVYVWSVRAWAIRPVCSVPRLNDTSTTSP